MKKSRVLVFVALLIAIEIILTRFFAFQTDTIRVGFGFIPVALAAMLFGPVIGGTTAMLSDILGMMIFPKGPYFPGFTLSALLRGVVFGLFLYKKEKTVLRTALAVLTTTVVIDLGLNYVWLTMLTGKAGTIMVINRFIKSLLMYPVQVFMIPFVWRYIGKNVERSFIYRKTSV